MVKARAHIRPAELDLECYLHQDAKAVELERIAGYFVLYQWRKGSWMGRCLDRPSIFSTGPSIGSVRQVMREALSPRTHLSLRRRGRAPAGHSA